MKLFQKSEKRITDRSRMVGIFLFCAVLTGCTGRNAEFLMEENREADVVETVREKETQSDGESGISKKDRMEIGESEISEIENMEAGKTGESETAGVLTETPIPAEIYVDVCGAVAKPGVFKLTEGSRVFQAIEAAGGYLPEAEETYVNRAGLLADGQQIYVPTEEEAADFLPGINSAGGNASEMKVQTSGEGISGGKVNINTADEAGLTTLTGIGATRAKAIISYREAQGPFGAIEDIMNVEGIKEGTFEKIKDDITIQ